MDNKKNTILLTVIAVATLLVAVVGATFAYFTAQGGDAVTKNITVTTAKAGNAAFEVDSAIAIYADATNFAQGGQNLTGVANGKASFTAPTSTGQGTIADKDLQYCYTVTVNISANDFEYTTDQNTPELTLTVTKGSDDVIAGEDITTKTGSIQVPTTAGGTDYVHVLKTTAGGSVSDTWKATVTLVNLGTDQNKNTEKSLTGTLKFAKSDTCEVK